jgi:hypothetical protein
MPSSHRLLLWGRGGGGSRGEAGDNGEPILFEQADRALRAIALATRGSWLS